jgi:hypothetical protein
MGRVSGRGEEGTGVPGLETTWAGGREVFIFIFFLSIISFIKEVMTLRVDGLQMGGVCLHVIF